MIEIERLRFVDDEPITLVTTYLPYDACPGVLQADLTQQSLYAFVEREYGPVHRPRRPDPRGRRSQPARI